MLKKVIPIVISLCLIFSISVMAENENIVVEEPAPEAPAVEDTPVVDNNTEEAKSPILGIILGVAAVVVIAVATVLIIKKK